MKFFDRYKKKLTEVEHGSGARRDPFEEPQKLLQLVIYHYGGVRGADLPSKASEPEDPEILRKRAYANLKISVKNLEVYIQGRAEKGKNSEAYKELFDTFEADFYDRFWKRE
jgi:hypothetical protein